MIVKDCMKIAVGVLCMTSAALNAYNEWTPFHRALFEGNLAAAQEAYNTASADEKERLLNESVFIHREEMYHWHPMHFAAAGGNVEAAECLRKLGALVHVSTGLGEMPLHMAAKYGHDEIVKWLIDADKQWCKANGQEFTTDWKTENSLKYKDRDATALYLACLYGHAGVVDTLLENGAKHTPETIADKAVHWAARGGYPEVMEVLRRWGADIERPKIFGGLTPFGIAIKEGHARLSWYLRKQGCLARFVMPPSDDFDLRTIPYRAALKIESDIVNRSIDHYIGHMASNITDDDGYRSKDISTQTGD